MDDLARLEGGGQSFVLNEQQPEVAFDICAIIRKY